MQTVLITGGSRGIGRAIVELFCERGFRVAFTYKASHEAARALALATGALAICADNGKEEDVIRAVRQTEEEFGHIDCLVNNAAVSSQSLFTDLTLASFRETLDVTLTGAFLCSREVLRGMIRRHTGKIINISSMWGVVGASCEVHYSAAKAGLIGMTKALAKEVGPSGIRVNAVAPGVIRTDMNSHLSGEDLASLSDETPLCRIGEAREIAEAVYFLASPSSDFITGEVLNVNGGFVI